MSWIRQVPFLHRSLGPNEMNIIHHGIVLLNSFESVRFGCIKNGLLHHWPLQAICSYLKPWSRIVYDVSSYFLWHYCVCFINMTPDIKLWEINRMEIGWKEDSDFFLVNSKKAEAMFIHSKYGRYFIICFSNGTCDMVLESSIVLSKNWTLAEKAQLHSYIFYQ